MILMDVQMPIMDGLEATRLLRAKGCKTPIVALTANADELTKKESRDAGMDLILSKPLGLSALRDALSTAISTD